MSLQTLFLICTCFVQVLTELLAQGNVGLGQGLLFLEFLLCSVFSPALLEDVTFTFLGDGPQKQSQIIYLLNYTAMTKNNNLDFPGYQSVVKIISWNCKGLNGAIKRGNILSHLKKLEMDIGFYKRLT